MNEATRNMILNQWLAGKEPSLETIERLARYMSRELNLGGMKACRALVLEALEGATFEPNTYDPMKDFNYVGSPDHY